LGKALLKLLFCEYHLPNLEEKRKYHDEYSERREEDEKLSEYQLSIGPLIKISCCSPDYSKGSTMQQHHVCHLITTSPFGVDAV
jgi:hypothetical protein